MDAIRHCLIPGQVPDIAAEQLIYAVVKPVQWNWPEQLIYAVAKPVQWNWPEQLIYAVAKPVQWNWPNKYGQDKFVVMLGGMHVEMAAGRGCAAVLVKAGVASFGIAESFITASGNTRTRQMHQITACSLYKLIQAAYTDYIQHAVCTSLYRQHTLTTYSMQFVQAYTGSIH